MAAAAIAVVTASRPLAGPAWVAIGVLLALSTGTAVAVIAAALLIFLVALGSRVLVPCLVGTTFVSGLRLELLSATFRPEHAILAAALVALLLEGRLIALVEAGRDRTVMLFGAFVAWSGVVSLTQAVEPGKSLLIVGWLALDWLILVVLVAVIPDPRTLTAQGLRFAGAAAAVALLLWAAAHLLGTRLGVATETVTGSLAASGLFHEPNILGTAMAAWAFLAVACPVASASMRRLVVGLALAGIMVSLTRAAAVALAGGLLTWAVLRGSSARRAAGRVVATAAGALAIVSLTAPGVVEPMLAKGSQLLNFGENTGQVRWAQWELALGDIDGTAWLIGLGANSFGQRHLEPTLPDTPTPAYHGNLPLQVLYDTGLVGVVLLGAALLTLLTRRRLRDGRALGLLVTYTLGAVATSPFWFGISWVLIAIALIDRRRIEAPLPVPLARSAHT